MITLRQKLFGSVRPFAALYLLIFFSGCMTLNFDARDVPVPVVMNSLQGREYTVVAHFSAGQDKSMFFLRRMFGGGQPDITAMLQKQLQKTPGDAIINLRIKGETNEIDVALPVMVGIAGAFAFAPLFVISLEPLFADLKSYTVEGDIIRYSETRKNIPLLPLIDPNTGEPIKDKEPAIEYDPDTGLPKKGP